MTAWKGAIMDAKERIIEQLKRSGCRVTKQRLMLIDVILEGKCNCCKEIYYQASLKDPSIGPGDGIPYGQYAGTDRSDQPQEYVSYFG